MFKLHYQKIFQRQNFLILEETERSSYLFLFCALQPSRYLPQEIKVIILASISNSECSDTGLFWLRMWVFLKWSMVITDAFQLPPYVFQYLILPWRFESNTGRCNQPDFPAFALFAVISTGYFSVFNFSFLCSIANFRHGNEKEVKRIFVVFKFRGNYPAQ